MVVVASRVPPATVTQWSRNPYAVVVLPVATRGGVTAVPFTLVLFLLASVKAGRSGLEMTQVFMEEVTQPKAEVLPDSTSFGFATRTMAGLETCTVHCLVETLPWSVQFRL